MNITIHFTPEEYRRYKALAQRNNLQFSTIVRILALPPDIPYLFNIVKGWVAANKKFAIFLHDIIHEYITLSQPEEDWVKEGNEVTRKLKMIIVTIKRAEGNRAIHNLHKYITKKLHLREVILPIGIQKPIKP